MKTVLITGASRGNGRAFAEKFLAKGWHVIGTSTSGNLSFHHNDLVPKQLDMSKPEQISAVADWVKANHPKLDMLINNAGINLSSSTERTHQTLVIDILRQSLEVNLIGLADLTERLLPILQGGQIIDISSGAGAFHPFVATGAFSYQISKAALNMYTKTLAGRLEDDLTVWSFDPGWVKTDMGGPQATKLPDAAASELYTLAKNIPPTGTFWEADKQRGW